MNKTPEPEEDPNVVDFSPVPDVEYKQTCILREQSNKSIYSISLNEWNRPSDKDPLLLATVGGDNVTIYQVLEDNEEDGQSNMRILQSYRDPSDEKEEYYCCAWGLDSSDQILNINQEECNSNGSFPSSDAIPSLPKSCQRQILAVAGKNGIIRIISPNTANCAASLCGHGNSINQLKFHPKEQKLLFSFSRDRTIRLWNIATRTLVAVFGGAGGHKVDILDGDISFTGNLMVSCGMDHNIKIWRLDYPKIKEAIRESQLYKAKNNKIPFKTIIQNFCDFSTRDIHGNYVDSAKWFGSFLVTKSCENSVIIWVPGPLEDENQVDNMTEVDGIYLPKRLKGDVCGVPTEDRVNIMHRLAAANCDIWFCKLDIDFHHQLLSVGSGSGPTKIYIWDLNQLETAFSLTPKILSVKYASVKSDDHLTLSQTSIRQTKFALKSKLLFASGDNGIVVRFDKINSSKPNSNDISSITTNGKESKRK